MVATFPDDPLDSSPVHHRVCLQQQSWVLEWSSVGQHAYASDMSLSATRVKDNPEQYWYAAEQVEPYWIAVVPLQASICPAPPVRV